jgi:hypothetical protein
MLIQDQAVAAVVVIMAAAAGAVHMTTALAVAAAAAVLPFSITEHSKPTLPGEREVLAFMQQVAAVRML